MTWGNSPPPLPSAASAPPASRGGPAALARRVLPAGLFLLLPLMAALAMSLAFAHLGETQEAATSSLAALRHVEERSTYMRWHCEAVTRGVPASAAILGELAEEFSVTLAGTVRERLQPDAGAEDDAARVHAAWARLDEEWADLQGLLPAVAKAPAGSRELAELGGRAEVHAAHLELAAHDLVAKSEVFERESLEADIGRLGLLATLLLLAFSGFSLVLFVRTAQVREREGQIRRLALVAEHSGSGMIVAD
ncbi:MAG: hypothetical protein IT348_12980, partial [Candidatus Eisenbacteria bacterium]|nr:hypothetical protein [Candidatus Eisenbacteria bacterium]